jgi:peptidyl-prolyl cis-trans isomerase A (cyclophilin A)
MKSLIILFSLLTTATIVQAQSVVNCVISTDFGDIEVELYAEKAPITVTNFLRYVDAGLYKNSSFYRVTTADNEANRDIKIEVIQGGNIPEGSTFDPIPIETTDKTGIKHLDGSISMARSDPNSATSSFFICINNQPELDYNGKRNPDGQGFAAFGRVTKGMDIVRKIQAGENEKQYLVELVTINNIERK